MLSSVEQIQLIVPTPTKHTTIQNIVGSFMAALRIAILAQRRLQRFYPLAWTLGTSSSLHSAYRPPCPLCSLGREALSAEPMLRRRGTRKSLQSSLAWPSYRPTCISQLSQAG